MTRHCRQCCRLASDRGNATVDFALVTPVLLAVVLAVVQLTLFLFVRMTLTSAAAEGARAAALAGASPVAGERRSRELLAGTLAANVVDRVVVRRELQDGLSVLTVDIEAQLPLVGLLGPSALTVSGRALAEQA